MSMIKSFSVGHGDMFYIAHNTDNFTIIDCCLDEETEDAILEELDDLDSEKGITRFISTHPDDDHIRGIERLDDRISILNFYCVKNQATKPDETDSFARYCELRDSSKAFYIKKGCDRKWMNQSDDKRKASGISILWPNPENEEFKKALEDAAEGMCPNNISSVIKYSLDGGMTALWMGDLETAFMETIESELELPKVDILFAPHHGRSSGRVPDELLEKMAPRVIVIGEAPSEHIHYYDGYDSITQNSAGDIIFECESGAVHVFTSNDYEAAFLDDWSRTRDGFYYAGTLDLSKKR